MKDRLAQYKKKQTLIQKATPNFIKRMQSLDLHEFRCNIDEKGNIDSPISLKWDPMFSQFDANKKTLRLNCSGIYHSKANRFDVLNLKHIHEYQQNLFGGKLNKEA